MTRERMSGCCEKYSEAFPVHLWLLGGTYCLNRRGRRRFRKALIPGVHREARSEYCTYLKGFFLPTIFRNYPDVKGTKKPGFIKDQAFLMKFTRKIFCAANTGLKKNGAIAAVRSCCSFDGSNGRRRTKGASVFVWRRRKIGTGHSISMSPGLPPKRPYRLVHDRYGKSGPHPQILPYPLDPP